MSEVPDPVQRMMSRIDDLAHEYLEAQQGVPEGFERCPYCRKIVDDLIQVSAAPDSAACCFDCLPVDVQKAWNQFEDLMREDNGS